MIHNIEDKFKNEVLLSISKDIARKKTKAHLLEFVRVNLKKIFYFTHSSTVLFSEDRRIYRSFIIDPLSKLKDNPDYQNYLKRAV